MVDDTNPEGQNHIDKSESKDVSKEPSSEAKNRMSLGIKNTKEGQDPPLPPDPPGKPHSDGSSPEEIEDREIKLGKAKNEIIEIREFNEERLEFQQSPDIQGISEDTRREYFKHQSELIGEEAKESANILLDDFKSKNPNKEEEFNLLDNLYGEKKFKELNAWESTIEPPVSNHHQEKTIVYQYLFEDGQESNYYSPNEYKDFNQAQKELALPRTPTIVRKVELPPGAVTLDGVVKDKFGQDDGGKQMILATKDMKRIVEK